MIYNKTERSDSIICDSSIYNSHFFYYSLPTVYTSEPAVMARLSR